MISFVNSSLTSICLQYVKCSLRLFCAGCRVASDHNQAANSAERGAHCRGWLVEFRLNSIVISFNANHLTVQSKALILHKISVADFSF